MDTSPTSSNENIIEDHVTNKSKYDNQMDAVIEKSKEFSDE